MKFVRQYPIGRYVADFYCHEVNLIVELEGSIHDSVDQRKYDNARFEELLGQGFRVLRIRNEAVLNDIESVLEMILEAIAPENPHPSREMIWSPLPLGEGFRGEGHK